MAYLYRLIALAGVLFLLLPAAQAAVPQVTAYSANTCNSSATPYYSTADAARQASLAQMYVCNPNAPANFYALTAISGNSFTICSSSCVYMVFAGTLTTQLQCPANSTLSGGSCVCNSGFVESGGSCISPPPVNDCSSLAGKVIGDYSGPGSVGPKHLCETALSSGDSTQPGCVITGIAEIATAQSGSYVWVASMSVTGAKCLPNPTGSTDATSGTGAPANSPSTGNGTQCSPGQLPGIVNGQTVCADAGPNDPVKTTTNSTGTQTLPDGTTVGTGITTSTDCTATTCTTTTTTTTTTTPPGGTATTSTTTSSGTCSRSAPGCGDGTSDDERSSFAGSCGAAFACDGDAIFCAVALEQHKRNCALFVDATPESDLYNTEKAKTGTQYQNENVALGTGNFNQTNALGTGAQCIQDRSITVMGRLVVLPFSIVCSTLQYFGTILIFISFLLAYRIVSRG